LPASCSLLPLRDGLRGARLIESMPFSSVSLLGAETEENFMVGAVAVARL